MPMTRFWTAKKEHRGQALIVQFECPFFSELLVENGGRLVKDFACQALWDYYGCALIAYDRAKKNFVYEDELSLIFDRTIAKNLFQSKANQHGVKPADMVRFWPLVHQQRIAMGGKDQLPDWAEFSYWGN